MSKNKILIAGGAFVLAIAGFLTTSAHKVYGAATSAYYFVNGSTTIVTLFKGTLSPNNLTTSFVSGKTAIFRTGSSTASKLFADRSGTALSHTIFVK